MKTTDLRAPPVSEGKEGAADGLGRLGHYNAGPAHSDVSAEENRPRPDAPREEGEKGRPARLGFQAAGCTGKWFYIFFFFLFFIYLFSKTYSNKIF
jgi:hypothetical protein